MWAKIWRIIGAVGGMLGLIATGLFIYTFLEQRATKRVLVTEIIRVDELTALKKVPNLTGNFVYNGKPVECLWWIEFKVTNAGKETLITTGSNKNLFTDYISYGFDKGETVLDVTIDDNGPQARPPKVVGSEFQVQFEQWKPSEVLTMSAFVATEHGYKGYPTLIYSYDRAIIDGEMLMAGDVHGIANRYEKRPLLDYLSTPFQIVLRIIIGVATSAVFLILTGFTFIGAIPDFWRLKRLKRWKKEYGTRYYKLLEEGVEQAWIPIDELNAWKIHPYKAWDRVWERFNGPKPPKGPKLFSSTKDALVTGAILLLIAAIYLIPFLAVIKV